MTDNRFLKTAGENERDGNLDKALATLLAAKEKHLNNFLSKIIENNIERVLFKARRKSCQVYLNAFPKPLFEHAANPLTYSKDTVESKTTLDPIISFTTISSRIDRVGITAESLLSQSYKPHSINLYVSPDRYLVDEGIAQDNEALKKLAAQGVNVYHVQNIGPYRKQIPIILQLRSVHASQRTPIVTVDDDVIYPPDLIARLMENLNKDECVVSHRGRRIEFTKAGRLAPYKSFSTPDRRTSFLNVGTGKNGIAYRLGHFPTNPEDFVGPVLAPTADDLWCKWVISTYCVPTKILEPKAAYDASLDFEETCPIDKNGLFHTYNAKGMNDHAISNLERYFEYRSKSLSSLFRNLSHE